MAQLLIVEDDARIRPLVVRALTERGHAVRSEATGMAGLNAAVELRPDLLVLDLGLPDVDGTQVLSMLRAVSDVPVIVATARDDDPTLVRCLEGGADDYVVKPYTVDQLAARITAVLRRVVAPAVRPRARSWSGGCASTCRRARPGSTTSSST